MGMIQTDGCEADPVSSPGLRRFRSRPLYRGRGLVGWGRAHGGSFGSFILTRTLTESLPPAAGGRPSSLRDMACTVPAWAPSTAVWWRRNAQPNPEGALSVPAIQVCQKAGVSVQA